MCVGGGGGQGNDNCGWGPGSVVRALCTRHIRVLAQDVGLSLCCSEATTIRWLTQGPVGGTQFAWYCQLRSGRVYWCDCDATMVRVWCVLDPRPSPQQEGSPGCTS